MPLKKGMSQEAFDSNVKELVDAFKKKGKIGNTKPKNKSHARRIAVAVAFDQKRKGKK